MKRLLIYGGASQKIIRTISLNEEEINDMSLLNFLQAHQIPVASSCLGDGVCKKCVSTNKDQKFLTCMVTLRDFFLNSQEEMLSFPYL